MFFAFLETVYMLIIYTSNRISFTPFSSLHSTMDLINKLRVLMKISLAGSETKSNSSNNEKEKGPRLSYHYLAQCLHRQCDMYELREMCRLQKVEVKRGAGKGEIIEALIDHLPNVNFDLSPKEIANKTRKMKERNPKPHSSSSSSAASSSSSPSRRFGDDAGDRDHQTLNLKRVASKCPNYFIHFRCR